MDLNDEILYEFSSFSKKIADTLDAAGVRIANPRLMGAVLIMVAPIEGPSDENPPVGGSLNYVNGKWEVAIDLATAEKYGGENN